MESGEKMQNFMHIHIRVFLQIEADHTEPLGQPGPSGDTDAPHVGTDVSTSTDSRIEVLLLSAVYGTSRGGGGGGGGGVSGTGNEEGVVASSLSPGVAISKSSSEELASYPGSLLFPPP